MFSSPSTSSRSNVQDREPLLNTTDSFLSERASAAYPPRHNHNAGEDLNSYDSEETAFSNGKNKSRSPSQSPPPYKGSSNRNIASSLDALAGSSYGSGNSRHSTFQMTRYRRRCLAIIVALIIAVALMSTGSMYVISKEDGEVAVKEGDISRGRATVTVTVTTTETPEPTQAPEEQSKAAESDKHEFNVLDYVLGDPKASFRENLRPDMKYITGWINAGWTNDFMTYANLVYLALLTNRTAVLGPFVPSHVGGDAGIIPLNEVFDVPRLNSLVDVPVIEWRDLKQENVTNETPREPIGCWSAWATVESNGRPRGTPLDNVLKLDFSYTPAPISTKLHPENKPDVHVSFWGLAALAFPDGRRRAGLPDQAPFAGQNGHTTLPEDHLLCYDFLYFVGATLMYEWENDWAPGWRLAGQYFHWTSRMENIGREYLKRLFGVPQEAAVPPYIAIHVRHGDFSAQCANAERKEDCFAPLSAYAKRVEEIRDELREKQGIEVQPNHILVTSDERDESWWAEVRALGWTWINHEQENTVEKHGKWYTVFIDAVAQSLGSGFVGTTGSTMSLVAQRRVEYWNNGVTRSVRWGWKDADQH